jgi:hypothetical protein
VRDIETQIVRDTGREGERQTEAEKLKQMVRKDMHEESNIMNVTQEDTQKHSDAE